MVNYLILTNACHGPINKMGHMLALTENASIRWDTLVGGALFITYGCFAIRFPLSFRGVLVTVEVRPNTSSLPGNVDGESVLLL